MVGAVQHISAEINRNAGIVGVLYSLHRDGKLGLVPYPTQILPGHRVLKDLAVVLKSSGLILMRWLREMLGEILIRVVVLHAEAAELRKVSPLQIGWPEAKSPGVNG